ncbi:hypothetical protein L2E82_15199 [Cichorium intybus]|uniref:Uncharacterized protein n=1 Tax=Cichorium intybus TaxID=13427 RepID=A0ACB9F261_CICIN|nr:hypothetical protein L2E82_15199 [Cichorium intybus]
MFILARILLLWFSFIFNTITQAQPEFIDNSVFYSYCENSANYTTNSTYQRNLESTLSGLPNTNSGFGFYNFSIGQGNDRVYSIALCRGDVESDLCRSCVDDSIVKLREICPNQREAIGFYDICLLQYSNETILGNNRTNNYFYLWNAQNASDGDRFNGSPGPLLNRLIAEAAAGGPLLKFGSSPPGTRVGQNFQRFMGLFSVLQIYQKRSAVLAWIIQSSGL